MSEPALVESVPTPTFALAVFASGRGSNLQALHQAGLAGVLPVHIAGVFSDRPDCGALAYAAQHGLHSQALIPNAYASRETFDTALMQATSACAPWLIVCAGYMRIISKDGIAAAPCPIINIHPSLLPKYPGLNTHARALAAGDSEHGASVHVVNDVLDGGRVLQQVRVPILEGDDAGGLAERVLSHEHALLIATVRAVCLGEITL